MSQPAYYWKDVATVILNPIIVSPDVTVKTAIALMNEAAFPDEVSSSEAAVSPLQTEARSSCVVVVESQRVIGIFTERDVVRLCAQGQSLDGIPIAQVMKSPVFTLPESALTEPFTVIDLLEREQIRHLPIVDQDNHLVGLVTLDLLAKNVQSQLRQLTQGFRAAQQKAEQRREQAEQEKQQAVQSLAQLNAELEERVSQRTKDLDEREARYRALMEGAADAIVISSPEGQILEANQQATSLLGYSLEELTTLTLQQLHPPEVLPRAIAAFTKTQRTPRIQITNLPCRRKDGSLVLVDITGSALEINGETVIQGIFHDVSERQATEHALQTSEAKYRQLVETALEGIWVIDDNAKHQFGNESLFKMMRLSAEEMAGRSLFDFFAPEFHSQIEELLERRRAGIAETNEVPLPRPDGSTLWVLASSSPIFNEAGEYIGAMSMLTDITQQKQAEIELQQLTERFSLALQAGEFGVWEWDLVNRPIWNERMYEIYGLQNVGAPVTYQDWRVLIHPDDIQALEAQLETRLRDNLSFNAEFRIYRTDGEMRWISSASQLYYDEQGNLIRLVGINQDITERKQSEIQLQVLTERLSLALRAGAYGVWEWDFHRDPLWDERMYEIYGLQDLERAITYQDWRAMIHHDDLAQIEAQIGEFLREKGGKSLLIAEIRVWRPNGELRWVQVFGQIQRDGEGNPLRLVGINQDITERKQTEQDLYESRAKFQRLVDDIDDKFLIFSHNREIVTYVSNGFEAIFGMPPEQILGQSWITTINWLPDSLTSAINKLNEMVETKANTQELELVFTRADGDVRTIRIVHHPVWDNVGNLLAIEGVVEDITEQKAAEAELRRTNAELERATRLKDDFLANMSHELRTPLNAILGMTEGLQDEIFGIINEKQRKALKTVESSASHLLSLINDILDVAKITSGQVELERSSVSVNQLCSSSLTFVKQLAVTKRIQLRTQIQPQVPDIWVDEIRIRQVLLNLLTNAVKFTPEGGTVTLRAAFVPGETLEAPAYLHIAVTDTGIGIAPEHIPQLFKPFMQIDGALNRKHMGTGLGLALVKQIVELHGGRVGLTSELGVGSCFTVDLPYPPQSYPAMPLASASEAVAETDNASPAFKEAPLILLAEDNLSNALTISCYLEAKGYRFIFATNGQEAVPLATSERPDLILMDIQMPDMDGFEAIQRIRQQEASQQIPIIAVTALAMDSDREKCLEAGANYYLSKPVKLKQLDLIIRDFLSEYHTL